MNEGMGEAATMEGLGKDRVLTEYSLRHLLSPNIFQATWNISLARHTSSLKQLTD